MSNSIPMIVNFILDESGSMATSSSETISGFNEYVQSLKKMDGKVLLSLTKFNDNAEICYAGIPLEEASELSGDDYKPNGFTALYDAIGETILAVQKRVPDDSGQAVLCVILTDGQENSSKKYSAEQIKQMISQREEAGNWTFVYLGADCTAWSAASMIGIQASNAIQYDASNIGCTMRAVAASTQNYSDALCHDELQADAFFAGNADDYVGGSDEPVVNSMGFTIVGGLKEA